MSLEPLAYKVDNIEAAAVDITEFVTGVDSVKFQGTGKIRSANLMFNAEEGAFISNADFTGTGKTPLFKQFTKIQIVFTDDNNKSKGLIVEVDQELGQKSVQGGNLLRH